MHEAPWGQAMRCCRDRCSDIVNAIKSISFSWTVATSFVNFRSPMKADTTQPLSSSTRCRDNTEEHVVTQNLQLASPFFSVLSKEIRLLIYEELLVVGKVYRKKYEPSRIEYEYGDSKIGVWRADRAHFHTPSLAILRVCKVVHQEAEPLFLSQNLFVLPVHWQWRAPFSQSSRNSWGSPLFSTAAFKYLRNISFALDMDDLHVDLMFRTRFSWAFRAINTLGRHSAWTFLYNEMNHKEFPTRFRGREHLYVENSHPDDNNEDNEVISRQVAPVCNDCSWSDITSKLKSLPLFYVEIDYTKAFCPYPYNCTHRSSINPCPAPGCAHRPLHMMRYDWVSGDKRTMLDLVGTISEDENKEILRLMRCDQVDLEELIRKGRLRFRGSEPSDRWNQWKIESLP